MATDTSAGGDALARSAEQAREWQLEQPRLQIPQCHSTAEIAVAAMPARPILRTARAIAPAAARNVEGAAADDGAREHVSDDRAGRDSTVIPARPERAPAVAVTSAGVVSFQSGVPSVSGASAADDGYSPATAAP